MRISRDTGIFGEYMKIQEGVASFARACREIVN